MLAYTMILFQDFADLYPVFKEQKV